MSRSSRSKVAFVSCVVAILVPCASLQAAEVQTTVQTIPNWGMGTGHLKPRTISVSQTTQKSPTLPTAKSRQVAMEDATKTRTRVQ